MKWIGAAMILCGCTAAGCCMALGHKYAEFCLNQLLRALEYMIRELQYRSPVLPELLIRGGEAARGAISEVLRRAGEILMEHRAATPSESMILAAETVSIPREAGALLELLSAGLGAFDLQGQLQGICEVRDECKNTLAILREGREQRLRSYQTLGLCAGAALAIILL